MRRFQCALLATVAVGLASAASASDLPTKAPVYKALPLAFNWTGFYAGVNIGGGFGRSATQDSVSLFPPGGGSAGVTNPISQVGFTHSPAGFIGGGQLGYNWQTGNWVLGVEGDWDFANQRETLSNNSFIASSVVVAPANLSYSDEQKISWLATARARLGWARESWLWYVTGGVAWGKIESNAALQVTGLNAGGTTVFGTAPGAGSASTVKTGWVIGTGVETTLAWMGMPSSNWSAKLEYLYVDLGTVNNTFTVPVTGGTTAYTFTSSSHIYDHIVRAGLNYRFGAPGTNAMAAMAAAPVRVANWTGFYAGVNIGGGVGRDQTDNSVALIPATAGGGTFTNPVSALSVTHSPAGAVAGGQLGYNWQTGNWILGVEGDWDWTSQRATVNSQNFLASTAVVAPASLNYSDEQKIGWLATARARLGWARDSWLWYVTGGVAWGKIESNYNLQVTGLNAGGTTVFGTAPATASSSTVKTGWVIGTGVETTLAWMGMPSNNWSAKLEYLYVDLGTVNNTFSVPVTATPANFYTFTSSSHIHDHIVRAGLNYRFAAR